MLNYKLEMSENKDILFCIQVYGPLNSIHGSRFKAPTVGDTENKLRGGCCEARDETGFVVREILS